VRAPRVEIGAGDGFDLLVSAVAVADVDWRDVLAHGPAVWTAVRDRAGTETAREAARFGRFGWINLIGLLAGVTGRGSRSDLVSLVDGTAADELRFAVAGGMRRQLRDRLGTHRLRDALAGDTRAGRELGRALATPGMLLQMTGWVRRTSDAELKAVLQRLLDRWPDLPVETAPVSARRARTRLPEVGGRALLAEVTPGIRYGPDSVVAERVADRTRPALGHHPKVAIVDAPERTRARGYDTDLALRLEVAGPGGAVEVGDGGLTSWTAMLTENRKERCMVSSVSTERLLSLAS
jgi:hypothetical protein